MRCWGLVSVSSYGLVTAWVMTACLLAEYAVPYRLLLELVLWVCVGMALCASW